MLSIGDVLPLHGILKGTIICNVEHHDGDCGAFARASRDYAIMISRNPNNGTWTGGAPRRRKAAIADGCLGHLIGLHELADLSSYKGEGPHQCSPGRLPHRQGSPGEDLSEDVPVRLHLDEDLANDDKADDAQHPLVRLLLLWKRPLLGEGGRHHLIYVG